MVTETSWDNLLRHLSSVLGSRHHSVARLELQHDLSDNNSARQKQQTVRRCEEVLGEKHQSRWDSWEVGPLCRPLFFHCSSCFFNVTLAHHGLVCALASFQAVATHKRRLVGPCELGAPSPRYDMVWHRDIGRGLCSANETTRFPSSLSTGSSLWGVHAFSMLEPFNPLSFVEPTIWPSHHAMSMLLVVQILACVNSSIWPCETTCSTHPVFGPLTTVFLSICPTVYPFPMKSICFKVPFIAGTIRPMQFAFTTFLPLTVLPFKTCTVWPKFYTFTMLLVIAPLAIITSLVKMPITTMAMGTVRPPLAFINSTIGKSKSSITIGLVVPELTIISGPIGPEMRSSAMSFVADPLSGILFTVLKHKFRSQLRYSHRLSWKLKFLNRRRSQEV